MSFLEKIRKKSEKEKKKILWTSVLGIAIILVFIWFLVMKYNFSRINFNNLKLPDLDMGEFKESKEGLNKLKKDLNDGIENEERNLKELEDLEEVEELKEKNNLQK